LIVIFLVFLGFFVNVRTMENNGMISSDSCFMLKSCFFCAFFRFLRPNKLEFFANVMLKRHVLVLELGVE
jgi:hypothetical protein